MNWKKYGATLVLVVCAAALGLYAYVDRKAVSDAERKERENDVFPAYRRQEVDRIELVQGAVKLIFEKRPSGDAGDTMWEMTSPRDERADAAEVDKLLGDIEFAGIVRKVDPDVAAGLDAPRVAGTLTMGRLVYRFALGAPAPTPEGASYFHLDREGTFVVSRDFATSLQKTPDAYRERTVVPYLSLEIEKLSVNGGGDDFTIERMDSVTFRLPELGLRASRETLDRVWGALAEGRAESFLEDSVADGAIGTAPLTIAMKPRDAAKPEGELKVGGVCPGHPEDTVMIRRKPTRLSACVPVGMLSGLHVTPAELVDKRLFAARGDEIAELALEPLPSGSKVEIARMGSGWHERSPTDRDLASDEVDQANALATSLAKGEALDVARGDTNASFPARARVRLQRGEAKGEETVELGPPSPTGGALVKRLADGAILRVSDALAHRLAPSPIALRGKQIFLPPLEGKLASVLEIQCDGRSERLTRDTSGWSLQKPPGYLADSPGTADLVNLVARAEAEAWVSETDDGSFGFDESACSITLGYEEDSGTRTVGIVFGRAAETGQYFAHPLGQSEVFLAPRSVRDEALRVLIDRSGFHVDSAEVDTLSLARGGSRLVLSHREGKLDLPDGGAADLGERIGLALDALRADDVVHLGKPTAREGFTRPSLEVRIRMKGDSGVREVHFVLGDSALILKERMFYARMDGVDATFAIARDRIAPLLDAL
jgi:hypothetical protein